MDRVGRLQAKLRRAKTESARLQLDLDWARADLGRAIAASSDPTLWSDRRAIHSGLPFGGMHGPDRAGLPR
jgi:hypothetical protein